MSPQEADFVVGLGIHRRDGLSTRKGHQPPGPRLRYSGKFEYVLTFDHEPNFFLFTSGQCQKAEKRF